ncbi:MAG: hypothetical protein K8R68_00360 [Bacteroidales bacterium]|nr:hypothetical protein [Bacteroidales bacterium]
MKKLTSFYLFCFTLMIIIAMISCDKDNSTGPENNNPKIEISSTSNPLEFSNDELEKKIIISNKGGGELNWEATSNPEWIILSKSTGLINDIPDTIDVTVDFAKVTYGIHTDKIKIQSNGGNLEIDVNLAFDAAIIPGVSIAGIELGTTYLTLMANLGIENAGFALQSNGDWYHYLWYLQTLGLTFRFTSNSSDTPYNGKTDFISVRIPYNGTPYNGTTDKYIGIGSSKDEVINAYGQSYIVESIEDIFPSENYDTYCYDNLGIKFYFKTDSTKVLKIAVY